MWQELIERIRSRDAKALARAISLVENESGDYEEFLANLPPTKNIPVIGVTGAPGAGKSTLVDSLIGMLVEQAKTVGVLCVDPSSPFNLGALLGDRIRMSSWYTHPNVFIRSLATRGSMGGLNPKIIEITELMKVFGFDNIIIETVGVGQSEIEIAGLADTTVVVVVPESGDEVQTMKAGLMEIADIFVVNKSDRPGADIFVKNLRLMLAPAFSSHREEVAIVKTIASEQQGIPELLEKIIAHQEHGDSGSRKIWLLTEKAWHLLQNRRMNGVDKNELKKQVEAAAAGKDFNIYRFARNFDRNAGI